MKTILKNTALAAWMLMFAGSLTSCKKEKDNLSLKGTSWKLVGIVDVETGVLQKYGDQNCKESETLIFKTNDTFFGAGHGSFCPFSGNYTANYSKRSFEVTSYRRECSAFYYCLISLVLTGREIHTFSHRKNELRLYYIETAYGHKHERYLLFKPI